MDLGFALALLLAGATPDRDAVRAELEGVAARIEQLKAAHARGDGGVRGDLHALLVRAQELAIALDRLDHPQPEGSPHPRVRGPTPDDLRERADAARDEADRIRSALDEVERSIGTFDPSLHASDGRFVTAGPAGSSAVSPTRRLQMLHARRERLLRTLALVLADADRLEAEARLLESAP